MFLVGNPERLACPWAQNSSSASLTPSALPSQESRGWGEAALSTGVDSAFHKLRHELVMFGLPTQLLFQPAQPT